MKTKKFLPEQFLWPVVIICVLFYTMPQSEIVGQVSKDFPFQSDHNDHRLSCTSFDRTIHFEENLGQTNASVPYFARGNGYNLYLTASEAVLVLQHPETGDSGSSCFVINLGLEGANPDPLITGCKEFPGKSNYFTGNNPEKWITNVPHYARIEYREIYPGIDLAYYGRGGQLEYDFIVSPGGDPEKILLKFNDELRTQIDEQGSLVLAWEGMEVTMKPPVAYQYREGVRNPVQAEYVFRSDNLVGFHLGTYDPVLPLVIDPVLVFATYLGTIGGESGNAIAVDAEGCVYVTGSTSSADFPALNCFQCELVPGMFKGLTDVYITKFNAEGTGIVYSTYLGGNWDDAGESIAVDANGQVCVTGRTSSRDDEGTPEYEGFPLMNAFQKEIGGTNFSDAFVTVLSATGSSLLYSSYLGGGGEDWGTGIAVDENGLVYVTGTEFSFDFPVKNAFMEEKGSYYFDAFVTKINPYLSDEESLIYSTHLGGIWDDYGNSIAADREGCAYVTGKTPATDFPVTSVPIQAERKGKNDVFVTKLAANGLSLEYSTYLGSVEDDEAVDIAVDTAGHAYVCGYGRDGFPVTPGTYEPAGRYFFLSKILPDGSDFVYSMHAPVAGPLAVDGLGQVYIGAFGNKNALLYAMNASGTDTVFTLSLKGDGNNFIQDIAVDPKRNVYVLAQTTSTDMATEGAYKSNLSGSMDVLVTKFGRSKEELVVEVLQEIPITNTLFDIYSIDLSSKEDPLTFLEEQVTDDKGLLHLPTDYYQPGMPFLIRTSPKKVLSGKKNRTDLDKYIYKAYVDNLIIDRDGNIKAQSLESDPNDTTRAYLWHSSLGFNLAVSIEWLASMDYISKLKAAFIKTNNMLYDITNGQAFLDWVTIYDDSVNWSNSDIQIFVNNTQWPSAAVDGYQNINGAVYMPPAFYSLIKNLNLELFYNAEAIDPSFLLWNTSIVHELGHYAFGFYDEYENAGGDEIFSNINFGFMDDPDDPNDPRSTEMSAYVPGDVLWDSYAETEHYSDRMESCWDYFVSEFEDPYLDMPLVIYILNPEYFGISSDDVMKGPNSNLENPDFSVGSMMGFDVRATTTTLPLLAYQYVDQLSRQPVRAGVYLKKAGKERCIEHGKTTQLGRIRLFNAELGDSVYAAARESDDWKFVETVVGDPSLKTGSDAEIIEMKTVNGVFDLLSAITFNEGGDPVYQCLSDRPFNHRRPSRSWVMQPPRENKL